MSARFLPCLMDIRRTAAAVLLAAAAAGLTGCTSAIDSRTGTPQDASVNTAGNNPSGVSQGNLPNTSG